MTDSAQEPRRVPWMGALIGAFVGLVAMLLTRDMAFWPSLGVAVLVGIGVGLIVLVIRSACQRWGSQ